MKSIAFLTILSLCLYQTVAAAIIFEDTFNREDGPPGNGWINYGNTSAVIENNVLRVEGSGMAGVFHPFTPLDAEAMTIAFDLKVTSNSLLVDLFPTPDCFHLMQNAQGMLYRDPDGTFNGPQHIGLLPLDTWAEIRIEFHLYRNLYTVYKDDVTLVEYARGNPVTLMNQWDFCGYPGSDYQVYIDNFRVWDNLGMFEANSDNISMDTADPEISLLAPAEGVSWAGGSTRQIQWSASDDSFVPEPVILSCSVDNGLTFQPIGTIQNTGSYTWQVFATETDQAVFRIEAIDLFGNTSLVQNPFIISASLPMAPMDVSIIPNPQYGFIQLFWGEVQFDMQGNPITPDGYLVLHCQDPQAALEDYTVLAYTSDNSFFHGGISWMPENFYYVVTVVEDDEDIRSAFEHFTLNDASKDGMKRPSATLKDFNAYLESARGGE